MVTGGIIINNITMDKNNIVEFEQLGIKLKVILTEANQFCFMDCKQDDCPCKTGYYKEYFVNDIKVKYWEYSPMTNNIEIKY